MTVGSVVLRRTARTRPSRDRWLVAYADMTTLLLAVFASLYAAAMARPVSALGTGLLDGQGRALLAAAPPAVAPAAPTAEAAGEAALVSLRASLGAIVDAHGELSDLDLSADARGLVLSLPEAGSFPSGRAEPTAEAELVLGEVGLVLATVPNPIRIEGHTDDRPMQSALFASNWDLSTARATRVVHLLIDRAGVPAARLSAAGYAEFRPRVANDSPEHRARNRRVDIVVLSLPEGDEPGGERR
jgi:chemotaxis protein MotB